MNGIVADIRHGVAGAFLLIRGRPEFAQHFDVSTAGFFRSYAAAILALPAYLFLVLAAARGGGGAVPAWAHVLEYVSLWLYFPILAALVTRLLGRGAALVPWTVAHNWTTAVVFGVSTLPIAIYHAGLGEPAAQFAGFGVIFFTIYAHWRAAHAALGGPWQVSAAGTCAHLTCSMLIQISILALIGAPEAAQAG